MKRIPENWAASQNLASKRSRVSNIQGEYESKKREMEEKAERSVLQEDSRCLQLKHEYDKKVTDLEMMNAMSRAKLQEMATQYNLEVAAVRKQGVEALQKTNKEMGEWIALQQAGTEAQAQQILSELQIMANAEHDRRMAGLQQKNEEEKANTERMQQLQLKRVIEMAEIAHAGKAEEWKRQAEIAHAEKAEEWKRQAEIAHAEKAEEWKREDERRASMMEAERREVARKAREVEAREAEIVRRKTEIEQIAMNKEAEIEEKEKQLIAREEEKLVAI